MKIANVTEQIEATDAGLAGSTFDDVNLSAASFANVNLTAARFRDVNMTDVSIDQANLTGMTIRGVLVDDLFAAYEARK